MYRRRRGCQSTPTARRARFDLAQLTGCLKCPRGARRISRDTLRSIEQGAGTASSESVFRVLRVLGSWTRGRSDGPYEDRRRKTASDELLPRRVRS